MLCAIFMQRAKRDYYPSCVQGVVVKRGGGGGGGELIGHWSYQKHRWQRYRPVPPRLLSG